MHVVSCAVYAGLLFTECLIILEKKEIICLFYTQFTPFPTDVKKTVRENAGNFDRFSKKTMEEGIEVRILLC